jgi:hypothetical protein
MLAFRLTVLNEHTSAKISGCRLRGNYMIAGRFIDGVSLGVLQAGNACAKLLCVREDETISSDGKSLSRQGKTLRFTNLPACEFDIHLLIYPVKHKLTLNCKS